MNINADNLSLNTTTTTIDLHLPGENFLVGDDMNCKLAKVNKRLKVLHWYSSKLNYAMSDISFMAPCLSLIIPQDLILTGLLLVIFPNSFGFIREAEDGGERGRCIDLGDMNINADNLSLNTTTTTIDLHLHSHNFLIGDVVNCKLAKVNQRLKTVHWYSSTLNYAESGISYMTPCISLIIPQDLILIGLLLVIFTDSFGFIREAKDGEGRGRGINLGDMNINAENLRLNTTTTTSDLHLHSHNCLVGDDVNCKLANVNKRLKFIQWYSSTLNMLCLASLTWHLAYLSLYLKI